MSEVGKLNPIKAAPLSEKPRAVTEDKLREVAQLYENQFIREMMKQMRATVQESGLIKKNNAEKIFSEQLDGEYVGKWVGAGGIGLSDLIYDQLMERYGTRLGLKQPVEKPQGPLDLNAKSNFSGFTEVRSAVGETALGIEKNTPLTLQAYNESEVQSELKSPWAGVLLDKKHLEMDQIQYQIKHDNGLESLIVTRGTGLGNGPNLSLGDRIEAGQRLGWVSAASPLFWTLKPDVSE